MRLALLSMGTLLAYSHMTNPLLEVNPGQCTLNRIQTTSRSGLSQTGFKPLWLNAHSHLASVNANQCALNRIECALSVQCERALRKNGCNDRLNAEIDKECLVRYGKEFQAVITLGMKDEYKY